MSASADSPFDVCLSEALVLSRGWVPRWLGKLLETLHQRETSAGNLNEKQVFSQARTALVGYRDLLASRFIAEIAEVVQGSAAPQGNAGSARSLRSLSFDDLELMDHQQVQETVELARVQQIVKMAADEELVAFNARLCRAQGYDVVRIETNPLRPEAVVGALMKALSGLHVDEAVRARWLHAGAVTLGTELQQFYRTLTLLLDGMGVEPAGYVVVHAAKARPAASAAPSAARSDSVPATSMLGSDALLTLDHLHQLLVGNLEQSGGAVTDQGTSGSGNAMVRTLAAEVVTLMLRRIAEDQRLLQPVRDMVQRLKPALLQLARTDPRFFADRHNPARRLLDAITMQSLAFTSEQDRGFMTYAQRVHETVMALQAPTQSLPELMPVLLQRFTEADAAIASRQAPKRGLAMKTLVRVEQRHLLAERVAIEIQARNDFARAPGVVRRFLTGPWAQVVAQARMDSAEQGEALPADAAAHRYMSVLPDLLWSSQLALASLNRPRLIKVIPGLLRTLREGLDAIDYPRPQAESFFATLMGLHEAAYKTQRNGSQPQDDPPSQQDPDEHEMWMQPEEARDTGFMEDLAIDTQPAFLDTQPVSMRDELTREEAALSSGGSLTVGCWVDLMEQGQTLRCRLSWASPHGTMFLFAAANGRSISLTKRGLERLQELGRLHVVADHGVVDEALDAVARQALFNSGKG
ncbi:MAG: DUF1631 domain-containing protein [Thiobacillus sp.]|nr:DUF1631 domain-containing protein [Thiobacillus sp.]